MGWKIFLTIVFVLFCDLIIFLFWVLIKILQFNNNLEEQMEIERKLKK